MRTDSLCDLKISIKSSNRLLYHINSIGVSHLKYLYRYFLSFKYFLYNDLITTTVYTCIVSKMYVL